jgi:cytidylate kinase
MNARIGLDRCLSFINAQLRNGVRKNGHQNDGRIRAVTISRQAGCGAAAVAQNLAGYLQTRTREDEPHWTVFDKNLVERVLQEHNLPQRLATYMPENWSSEVADTMDQLFGLHPPSWILVRETAETVLRLAKLGNVIIIGRGANIITARLDSVVHVRLVASLESRIKHIQETDRLDRKAALEFIQREDKGRRRYLRKFYGRDVNDPLLYHFVINTDLIGYQAAAQMIGDMVLTGKTPNSKVQISVNLQASSSKI